MNGELRGKEIRIGKDEKCEIRIAKNEATALVSGLHCIISRDDNNVVVVDKSTNGTFILQSNEFRRLPKNESVLLDAPYRLRFHSLECTIRIAIPFENDPYVDDDFQNATTLGK